MRVDIKDRAALSGVRPDDMAMYLRANGWKEHGDPARIWTSFVKNDTAVDVPLSTHWHDFPQRIAEALRTLEQVEERDQLEILTDVSRVSDDVIRIRLVDPDTSDCTVTLERASRLTMGTFEMLHAAACAAVHPVRHYASQKPQMAAEYMRNVRMGQTERGSFVLTALSRVPLPLPVSSTRNDSDVPQPFERRVTEQLALALNAASSAAIKAIATREFAMFEKAVAQGVSADLCEAVACLGASESACADVDIAISWASSRPGNPDLPVKSQFPAAAMPILQEVAHLLRSAVPTR
jgi:hypothetical protein